jgi:hypothetical protein
MTPQEGIILAAQNQGCDAVDVRDAAHEMCHAFAAEADDWSRNGVHEALKAMHSRRPSSLLREEVLARAVERKVCEHFKVEYDSEHWLMMASMETMREFSNIPNGFWEEAVGNCMKSRECREMVERILTTGEDLAHDAL